MATRSVLVVGVGYQGDRQLNWAGCKFVVHQGVTREFAGDLPFKAVLLYKHTCSVKGEMYGKARHSQRMFTPAVPGQVVISPLGGNCKAIPASSCCASAYVQPHVSEQLRALGAVACRCAPYEQLRALRVLFGRSISWTAMACCSNGIV